MVVRQVDREMWFCSFVFFMLMCVILAGCAGQEGKPGRDGHNGVDGTDGQNGTPGATGPQGPQGNQGQPGTTVKFCPSKVVSYPTSFPEFGICVDNVIYAVYWDGHNSWLTEVPQGAYISTSTSAPCNFTVLANCAIQEN